MQVGASDISCPRCCGGGGECPQGGGPVRGPLEQPEVCERRRLREAARRKALVQRAAQLREIAEAKMVDLNANDIEAAMKIIAGSARSMGLEVSG